MYMPDNLPVSLPPFFSPSLFPFLNICVRFYFFPLSLFVSLAFPLSFSAVLVNKLRKVRPFKPKHAEAG